MNLSFDSDLQNLNNESNFESDIDGQQLSAQEISHYQETINDLKQQNLLLKAQFEQAVSVSKKIDNVHEENFKLSNQIRTLQLENENLKCRIQILIHNNEELESQLSEFKSTFAQQVLQANSEKEIELSKTQKICNGKIGTLLTRINKSEEIKEKNILEVKMLNSKINRMLQSANDYFQIKFEEIDSFTDFLNQTSKKIESEPLQKPLIIEPIQKPPKNKNEKSKIKSLKNQCKILVKEINKLHDQINKSETDHSNEIKKYQNEIQKIKDDLEISQKESNQTITLLQTKNQSLKSQFVKLRKEATEMQSTFLASQHQKINSNLNSPQKNSMENDKLLIENLQNENEKLRGKVNEMSNKIKQLDETKSDLLSKVKEANDAKEKLESVIDQKEIEKQALEAVKKETMEELKNVKEMMRSKEEEEERMKPKETIEKYKDEINKLEGIIKSNTNEIQSLNLQKQNESLEKSSILAKYNSSLSEIDELKTKLASLNDELSELNEKISSKPDLKPEDVLPNNCFQCKDFDISLGQKIDQVAFNQYLSPPSKLSQIYGLILSHYDGLLKEQSAAALNASETLDSLKKKFNAFLVDLSIALSFNALTVDDFMFQGGQKLVDKAAENAKNVDELKRRNSQLYSVVAQISFEFNVRFGSDIYSQIPFLTQSITSHFANFKVTNRRFNELKKRNKVSRNSFLSKITSLEHTKDELTAKCQELQSQNDDLSKRNQELTKEVKMHKLEVRSTKAAMNQNEESLKDDHQNSIDDLTKKFLTEKGQLIGQIEKMKNENEKAKSALSDTESSCSKMKGLINKHKSEIKELRNELEAVKKDKENEISLLNDKFSSEKKELAKTFENALNDLKGQCEGQRNEVTQIAMKLKNKDEKYRNALTSIYQLKRENQKLELNLKTLQDQIDREKAISEASIKNQILTIESECSKQLSDATARIESEKRRIFAIAFDEFRNFSNASKSIDERSYKSLLNKIKTELKKLEIIRQ